MKETLGVLARSRAPPRDVPIQFISSTLASSPRRGKMDGRITERTLLSLSLSLSLYFFSRTSRDTSRTPALEDSLSLSLSLSRFEPPHIRVGLARGPVFLSPPSRSPPRSSCMFVPLACSRARSRSNGHSRITRGSGDILSSSRNLTDARRVSTKILGLDSRGERRLGSTFVCIWIDEEIARVFTDNQLIKR